MNWTLRRTHQRRRLAGSDRMKQLPPPARASQRTLPPWRCAIWRTRLRPRPTPPACSACPGQAVERLEDPLARRLGNARAAVAHLQLDRARRDPLELHLDLRRRHSGAHSRAGCAARGAAAARHRAPAASARPCTWRIDARRLLGRQRQQVDRIAAPARRPPHRAGWPAAPPRPARRARRCWYRSRAAAASRWAGGAPSSIVDRHLQPRQRRAQLVAGIGQAGSGASAPAPRPAPPPG